MSKNRSIRTMPNSAWRATACAAAALCSMATPRGVRAADDDGSVQSLDRVVVSAQKREQAALDVPASVTAVSAEKLARGGLVRLEDYAAQVPGLSLSSFRQGFTQVTLRGITTGIAQSQSTTSFYIDEAPVGSTNAYAQGSSITPDLDPYDLRRVEVLKGPQGTLYGAGAMGGMLRYVTATPDYNRFGGSVMLGGNAVNKGSDGMQGRAALNVPLVEGKMALRVSAFSRKDAGYIDNPVNGATNVNQTRTDGGRLGYSWAIDDAWSLQAFALTQRVKADGLGVEDVDGATLRPLYGELQHKAYAPETQKAGLDLYNLTVKGTVAGLSIVSSTTYQVIDSDQRSDATNSYGVALGAAFGLPGLGIRSQNLTHTQRTSQELRARGAALADRLEYEAGVYYTQEHSTNRIPAFDPFDTATGATIPLPELVNALIDSRYKETSVFANGSYAVTPQLDVQLGVRYGENKQPYAQNYHGALIGPTPVILDKSSSESKTTYLGSVRFKPTASDSIYLRTATGYRPGGPNAIPPTGVPGAEQSYRSDSLTSVELGYKSVLAGGKVSLEAALFNTEWKDIQIQTSAQGFNFFVNGGKARSQGGEAALYINPMAALSLRASLGYTAATLTSDATAAGGLNGDRLPFVPRITASLGGEYRMAVTGGLTALLGASVNHVGERRSDFANKSPVDVPAYTTVNLNTGFELERWRVSIYGKNLGDTRGITFLKSQTLTSGGNPFGAGVTQPRTWGADLSYRF